jgi:hypothetical protein
MTDIVNIANVDIAALAIIAIAYSFIRFYKLFNLKIRKTIYAAVIIHDQSYYYEPNLDAAKWLAKPSD